MSNALWSQGITKLTPWELLLAILDGVSRANFSKKDGHVQFKEPRKQMNSQHIYCKCDTFCLPLGTKTFPS